MLIDSHCHLDFPDFAEDLDGVIERAGQAGVGLMITISTSMAGFPRVRAIAERFPQVYCTVGVHPHEASEDWGLDAQRLVEAASHPKVIGIGETGLDFYYDQSPRDRQADSFRAHIQAARESGLPIIIHTRDAEPETIAMLEAEYRAGPFPGLIHCFTGSQALADAALGLGLSISASGIVTFKSAEALRQVIATVPLDRLLVETDSPYLAPIPKRGKRNEPAFVSHTAAVVAGLKGVSVADLAAATTANVHRLFSKLPAGQGKAIAA
ncbi:MAG: TatD family deoxyribonuclease [Alphaproteobacteria bacterium]|nr:MAG: TatD family deoxyribonuclease [Alphaproteobacteria bacterium]